MPIGYNGFPNRFIGIPLDTVVSNWIQWYPIGYNGIPLDGQWDLIVATQQRDKYVPKKVSNSNAEVNTSRLILIFQLCLMHVPLSLC